MFIFDAFKTIANIHSMDCCNKRTLPPMLIWIDCVCIKWRKKKDSVLCCVDFGLFRCSIKKFHRKRNVILKWLAHTTILSEFKNNWTFLLAFCTCDRQRMPENTFFFVSKCKITNKCGLTFRLNNFMHKNFRKKRRGEKNSNFYAKIVFFFSFQISNRLLIKLSGYNRDTRGK